MPQTRIFLAWVVVILGCECLVAQARKVDKLRTAVDEYIDLRHESTDADLAVLLEMLSDARISNAGELEPFVRSERANYPDTSEWIGKTTTHDVQCLHVDYASRFFLYVPKKLDSAKSNALVVVGHGGNSSMSTSRAEGTAKMYLQAYRPLADKMNAVLVAPASSRGWGQIGNSLILSTISKIQRSLPIDPDRIYITGQSMGGHLTYRSALSFPDRFAAVSPHSGGYDFVAKQSIGNLINVPGYAVWGRREPYGIRGDNQTNQKWAEAHDLDWQFVEKSGGHTIYQDELENLARFFDERPRNLYRKQVYIRSGGAFKFVKTWQIKGWPEHEIYGDTKPLRWNMRHWIEVEARPDLEEPLELLATNLGENRIKIESRNVRKLAVFLHPKMVSFDKPVVIEVNGGVLFNAPVESDPRLMLNLAREFDDRGRIFWARVDVEVDTDGEVQLAEKSK